MSGDELNDCFKHWNPMENDYKNTKFNQYISGPGAELDAELQPGQQALQQNQANEQPAPTLVIKKIPMGMTKKAMHNICSRHGRVKTVRDSTKNDYYFVELATVADMEAVFRALENNNYGFEVLVGKNQNRDKNSSEMKRNWQNQYVAPVPPKTTGIDYQSRTYRTSDKQHPRPKSNRKPLVNNNSAEVITGLPLKLLADDAHSLERQGLYQMPSNTKFNYRNGRAYVNLPDKTKQFIDKKHAESSGYYNGSVDKYIHTSENNILSNNFQKCFVCYYACDTVCARCSQYYCSIECQQSDWYQHRYICGKPKHLQRTPPSKEQKQPEKNKTTQTSTENKNISNIKSNNPCEQKPSLNVSPSTSLQAASSPLSSIVKNSIASDEQIDKENMPCSGNLVVITSISKTNLVFIRSKTLEANVSYFNTIDALQAVGNMLQPLKAIPQSGQMVIAKFQNQYNRALVLRFKALEEIIVHLMDYGNIEVVTLKDLYDSPVEFISKPRYAIPVLLKDVPDVFMTQEVRKFMYTYLNNNINVEIRYKPEDIHVINKVYAVELIDENTQQNLNKIIYKLLKPVEPRNPDELCNRGYLEQTLLPTGDDVEYFVMDNSLMCSGCISCTIEPYVEEIEKFQKDLQLYAESIPNEIYTPRVDELCIARYSVDGLWYRGICLEAVGDGHPSIHFIDYGNISIVPIRDIRRYPRQFTFPQRTADCEIKGLPQDCDDKLIAKLEQLIPNGQIIKCKNVTVVKEDNFYSISLPNIIKELIDCGLLKNYATIL